MKRLAQKTRSLVRSMNEGIFYSRQTRRSLVHSVNEGIVHSFLGLRIKYVDHEAPRRNPAIIQIEATSKCNLRCPQCSNSRENYSGQHLTLSEFGTILDRLPFSFNLVILSGIGEPLLSPDLFPVIDSLAEKHIMCCFYTNGTLLTPQKCEAILQRHNVVSLAISCDGAEKKTFENSRVGANFETWLQFVRYFLTRVKEQRPDLLVSVNTLITKQNLDQLEDIIRLVAELGFDSIHFLDPIPVDAIAAANIPSKIELSSIDFGNLSELGSSLGLKVSWKIRRDPVPPKAVPICLQPWEYIFIRTNGDIQPCCSVFGTENAAVMGNIFEKNFANIWNGDLFREFRRTSAIGTNSLCNECPYY